MRVDLLEETLDRLEREGRRPKFIYTVPNFQNPAGVTMSLSGAGGWWRSRTSASCSCSRTTRTGCCATRATPLPTLYALDGGVYVMYLGTFSKILSPGIRLGWVVAPPPVLEKINLGKQAADLCTSTLSQLMVEAYFERGRLARLRRLAHRDLPRAPRHDARRAGRVLPARGRVDAPGRRPVHLGDAARLHRHHRPAGARAARQRGLRARARPPTSTGAAASSMRLNFSGVGRGRDPRGHPPDRQGREASRSRCTARSPARRSAVAGGRAEPARPRARPEGAAPTCVPPARRAGERRGAAAS